jgi:hypothetical protein
VTRESLGAALASPGVLFLLTPAKGIFTKLSPYAEKNFVTLSCDTRRRARSGESKPFVWAPEQASIIIKSPLLSVVHFPTGPIALFSSQVVRESYS